MMKTIIMAGGAGTRISSIASDIPKPMIEVNGMPVLEHEINCLRSQGFTDLILTVSHLGSVIMNYFGDGSRRSPVTGKPFGVNITYYNEKQPLGNAGALFMMKEQLEGASFLLLNADIVFNVDFRRMAAYHRNKGGLVTLFSHPNSHPYDSGLLIAEKDLSVKAWLAKEDERPVYYKNRVNAGLHMIDPQALELASVDPQKIGTVDPSTGKPVRIDLDRDLLKPLVGTGKMFCYDSPEYVKDMGTPERFRAVQEDFRTGRVQAGNLINKQKAVFLDRDGVINAYRGFIRNIADFELLPGAAEAIRTMNGKGYLVIVVTNQPVIARGEVTWEQLDEIHNKMETLLGMQGAYIDGVYFCPHHPNKGYEGEVTELKIDCNCRKPKPGMLLKAAEDFNIDLEHSWMVGDSGNDIKAGLAAGCRTALVNGAGTLQATGGFGQNITVENLFAFVEKVFMGGG